MADYFKVVLTKGDAVMVFGVQSSRGLRLFPGAVPPGMISAAGHIDVELILPPGERARLAAGTTEGDDHDDDTRQARPPES